jgi:antitoxin StbD
MEILLARTSVSVTELKQSPSTVIAAANGEPVAVLNHNRPAAYLVPAATFAAMMERLDDLDLADLVRARQHEQTIDISLDEL